MKNSFAPVFSGILDSSLWEEAYAVRILFVSMLALKDSDHVVRFNDYQLHRRANLKLEEVQEALKVLQDPDPRRTGQHHDGRRIQKTEDGWLILNGQFYEDQMRLVSLRAYQARKQREYRDRKTGPKMKGETATESALAVGDQKGADAIEKELEEETSQRVQATLSPPAASRPPIVKPAVLPAGVKTGAALVNPVLERIRTAQAAAQNQPLHGNWRETTVNAKPANTVPQKPPPRPTPSLSPEPPDPDDAPFE